MAIDGQPAEPFLARDSRIVLGPGNRIDLFLDATGEPGTKAPIMLENAGTETSARSPRLWTPKLFVPRPCSIPSRCRPIRCRTASICAVHFARTCRSPPEAHPTLSPHERPALFTVKRGRIVVLALVNQTELGQAVHLHGHSMRLLDRLDDGWKPFWLDTIMVAAKQTERVAFLADNPGRWLIDCRALGRTEGTATWFEVT